MGRKESKQTKKKQDLGLLSNKIAGYEHFKSDFRHIKMYIISSKIPGAGPQGKCSKIFNTFSLFYNYSFLFLLS